MTLDGLNDLFARSSIVTIVQRTKEIDGEIVVDRVALMNRVRQAFASVEGNSNDQGR